MKYRISLLIACLSIIANAQAPPASMIEVIATPEKFDGKTVSTHGFLRIGREPGHGVEAFLYINQDDARNLLLFNGIPVIPSNQMIRDMERIDDVYVEITGTLEAFTIAEGRRRVQMKNVQRCALWSDPSRPKGKNPSPESPQKTK